MEKLSERARRYASEAHAQTNHHYDDKPYSYHLQMVADTAARFFAEHDFSEEEKERILAAAWTHDVIEDARQTYNDVKKELGEEVAEIAFALTNEKGKTRKDRASATYYAGIRNTPLAVYVKYCDRIANVSHSLANGSRLFEVYKKENAHFCEQLGEEYPVLSAYLKGLFEKV